MNELGIPFNILFDNILEITSVSMTPKIIIASTAIVALIDCIAPIK